MRAKGARGGRRKAELAVERLNVAVADDSLREKARRRLHHMLDSSDDRLALRAATALFSYAQAKPPDEAPPQHEEPAQIRHERGLTLADLAFYAVEIGPTSDTLRAIEKALAHGTVTAADLRQLADRAPARPDATPAGSPADTAGAAGDVPSQRSIELEPESELAQSGPPVLQRSGLDPLPEEAEL